MGNFVLFDGYFSLHCVYFRFSGKGPALKFYGAQLIVNFIWPILFFNLRVYWIDFIWLVLLWILILAMIARFSRIQKWAGYLQIPYLLWVTFAGYLSFFVALLN